MSRRTLFLEQVRNVAVTALCNGAERVSVAHIRWNVAGECRDPVTTWLHGRPSPEHRRVPGLRQVLDEIERHFGERPEYRVFSTRRGHRRDVVVRPGKTGPTFVELIARCRRCDWCLKQRSKYWARRMIAECRQSARSWLVTLTLSPSSHNVSANLARRYIARQGSDFDGLPYSEQFSLRCEMIAPQITKYLKRVRFEMEAPGGALRYALVTEHHKSGLPHFHLLMHEQWHQYPVRKRTIENQWWLGHAGAELVDLEEVRQMAYAAKYLGKASVARVRASALYGIRALPIETRPGDVSCG